MRLVTRAIRSCSSSFGLLLLGVGDLLDGLQRLLARLDDEAGAEAIGAGAPEGRHLVLARLDDGGDEVVLDGDALEQLVGDEPQSSAL
jgi:hypothetical protein